MSENDHLIQLDNIGNILSDIGSKLIQNKKLMRLIKYNQSNALSSSLPDVTMTEIIKLVGKNPNHLQEQRIFKVLINDNIIDEVRVELRFGVSTIQPINLHIAKLPIDFQIIVHNSLWELDDNKFRAFEIIKELLSDLNGNSDDVKGVGQLQLIKPISFIIFNKNFSGYAMIMNIGTN